MIRVSLLLLLLGGCGRLPVPYYHDVVATDAISVLYDDAGVLHVLYYGDDGALRYGTVADPDTDPVPTDDGPLLLDGNELTGSYDADLAIRPGTSEVWAWIGGGIGVITSPTEWDHRLELGHGDSDVRGGLGFQDASTLHTGVQGYDWQIVEVADDGSIAGEPVVLMHDAIGSTPEGPVIAPCDIEMFDGNLVWATWCPDEVPSYLPTVLDLETGFGVGTRSDLAIRPGWLVQGCGILPTDADHVADPEAECDPTWEHQRLLMPSMLAGDEAHEEIAIHPDGDRVAFAMRDSLGFATPEKPPRFERDKTGTWCGVAGTVAFNDDGTYVPPSVGTEALYTKRTWDQSADKITTHLTGGDASLNYGPEHTDHWAIRVGDTLTIRTATTQGELDHMIDAGFRTLTGTYTLCAP